MQFYPSVTVPNDLIEFTADPLLARLLVQRGHETVAEARAFLDPAAYQPAPPAVLPDMEAAVDRLRRAIEQGELICVWGDFDVDGQTSTALLVSTLEQLGANVIYYIPNRLRESHGIRLPSLRRILAQGVDLLLTCDTGIAEHEALIAARQVGTDVIVTDHHDLADSLPPALALINPKRLAPDHPLASLPGVGVAYKLAQALLAGDQSDFLLDLVALGIVADIAHQSGDTRYLLQKGLAVLQQTPRPGLQALLENANLAGVDRLTEEHISYWLAPRLNALGRLGDANLGVELLTTADRGRARILALQLEGFNDRRKLLVDQVAVQALGQLEDSPALADYNAIVLAAAGWHPGVIGIAASRLVDQYNRPVLLIGLQPEGMGRGSARSVPGCDIHQAIKSQAHLLANFGGHPMAAGFSIPAQHIAAFRQGVSEALTGCRTEADQALMIDAQVDLSQVSATLLATIQRLAPFGPGNPPVQLCATGLAIVEEGIFGQTGAHRRLVVADETGCRQKAVWWGGAAERLPQGPFDLAFTLSRDDYHGPEAVQLEWLAAREWQPPAVVPSVELIDWRGVSNVQSQLADRKAELAARQSDQPSLLIWAEGGELPLFSGLARHELYPAPELVIWTAPPGQDVLEQVVGRVEPRRIYLVAQPPPFDAFAPFGRRLMGLIKYAATHKAGQTGLIELAAALGHRPATIRLGLDWLAAAGKLSYARPDEATLHLSLADPPPPEAAAAASIEATLKAALAETAAYRRFFQQAGLDSLRPILA